MAKSQTKSNSPKIGRAKRRGKVADPQAILSRKRQNVLMTFGYKGKEKDFWKYAPDSKQAWFRAWLEERKLFPSK